MKIVLWIALGVLAYTYLLFPLLLLLRARLAPRRHRSQDVTPAVSILIAAHDEADTIGPKIENLLALDYPADRLEIVVASDGSSDGTDEIVQGYAWNVGARRLRLLALPRRGKAATLTDAVAAAQGDVLVFSDANSMFAPDAVAALMRPFADPSVGGVAGDQRYQRGEDEHGVAGGERSYWSFDRLLKEAESRAGNVISATGAIYAIRRALFDPIPEGVTDDFYVSTGVITKGHRLVFAASAVAYEPVAGRAGVEFGRKVRVMTRGLRSVLARRKLLNPARFGFYSLQLLTHKVLRRLMVFPLLLLLITSALLWDDGFGYRALTVAQSALYGAAAAGIGFRGTRLGSSKPLAFPAYFCLVNAASLVAIWNLLRGRRIERWQPQRSGKTHANAEKATMDLPQ